MGKNKEMIHLSPTDFITYNICPAQLAARKAEYWHNDTTESMILGLVFHKVMEDSANKDRFASMSTMEEFENILNQGKFFDAGAVAAKRTTFKMSFINKLSNVLTMPLKFAPISPKGSHIDKEIYFKQPEEGFMLTGRVDEVDYDEKTNHLWITDYKLIKDFSGFWNQTEERHIALDDMYYNQVATYAYMLASTDNYTSKTEITAYLRCVTQAGNRLDLKYEFGTVRDVLEDSSMLLEKYKTMLATISLADVPYCGRCAYCAKANNVIHAVADPYLTF